MRHLSKETLIFLYDIDNAEFSTLIPVALQICKHFLDAVENNKYGWFWSCPEGGTNCKYRHALPPGFVLKKDKKK